jgi:hypothetical protein
MYWCILTSEYAMKRGEINKNPHKIRESIVGYPTFQFQTRFLFE